MWLAQFLTASEHFKQLVLIEKMCVVLSLVYPEKELAFSKHTLLTPSLPQKVTYHHTFTRDDLASQPVNV